MFTTVTQLLPNRNESAHLRRHFQRLLKLPGKFNTEIGVAFLNLIDEAFLKHRIWRETQDQSADRDWAQGFLTKVNGKVQQWLGKAGHEAGKLLRSVQQKSQQWWYFLQHPEVPPDNNLAERSLRLAVTKRKVSGGSRSMERFQHTANLLSVVQTCRRQCRSVIDFFEQALKASAGHCQICPSLLTTFDT